MPICKQCATALPPKAKFCFNCGTKVESVKYIKNNISILDVKGDVEKQFKDLFFKKLKEVLEEEQDVSKLSEYSERVYQSGFRDFLHRRAAQLSEKVKAVDFDLSGLNTTVDNTLKELLDIFIIRDCADLNVVAMPEAILKYQQVKMQDVDLFTLIMDYLHFDTEEEVVFTDFLKMPVEKLKNAGKSFLFPDKGERIFFLCDLSLLGSCKEGFAMTEKGIYWKVHLQKAKKVMFSELQEIKRTEDWLTINDYFFNANVGINIKLMKLLRRLRVV